MSRHKKTLKDDKNGPEMAQTSNISRLSKTHPEYWKPRLVHRNYLNRDGTVTQMPEWHIRLADAGRREWFNLNTPNQSTAATKARDIYLSIQSSGWQITLEKHKPSKIAKADVCTVGEFIHAVKEHSHLKPITVRRYAVKLRKMIVDIAGLEKGLKGKAKKLKYDYVNGGQKQWLETINKQSLGILTSESVNAWRNNYVNKAGDDPLKRKSAERSAAGCIRCSRALFSTEIISVLPLKVPENPFTGVKLRDPGPQRYRSTINIEWLLGCAERDLNNVEREQEYLALNLCLWGGLRRKEADLLEWNQIDFKEGQLSVCRTEYFEPKTEESQRTVDLPDEALNTFRKFKKGSASNFVLRGASPNLSATYDYYRCDKVWRALNKWLRGKGLKDIKAIHALRKESGSLIASTYGIEAAREHLGHRDISTTSSHYVSKKARREVILTSNKRKAI
jgi:integrase